MVDGGEQLSESEVAGVRPPVAVERKLIGQKLGKQAEGAGEH